MCNQYVCVYSTVITFSLVVSLVSNLASKVLDILNSAHEEDGSHGAGDDSNPVTLQVISGNGKSR